MQKIIGRAAEKEIFQNILASNKPEFVAVYGRRRVGKTFLIRNVFEEPFTFQMSGVANMGMEQQLSNFFTSYNQLVIKPLEKIPKNWFEAFEFLRLLIQNSPSEKSIIFLDELPWLDTPKSNFVSALEYFWNSFGSTVEGLKLIVCGSAASWMINKLINNHGGLHNRVTRRIHLKPFSLKEVEQFLRAKNVILDRYQILQLYFVMGGIPFYLDEVETGQSAFQVIDKCCFSPNGLLRNEYDNLFHSIFQKAETHIAIIEALCTKSKGLTRDEIIKTAKIPNGGTTTKVLEELALSGFIKKYSPYNRKFRNSIYQLTDPYCLFYNKFLRDTKAEGDDAWINFLDSSAWRAWSGYAFEYVCMSHTSNIKKALGISGVYTETSAWKSETKANGAQIDLLIDRKDQIINLCEIKFSKDKFEISKAYADTLRNKISVFETENKIQKTIFLTMVTTKGILPNIHSIGLVQNSITMDDLFE